MARGEEKRQAWAADPASWCPCGEAQIPYEVRHTTTYCSEECRKLYKPTRQKDPANYVTFNCQNPNCGKEVTRYKRYGNGASKFCSNECATKFTKTKHHLAFGDDDVLLDSTWEGLFYCLCKFRRIPIERVDRAKAIEWKPGHWYAPDFLMGTTWVEVKGLEDDEDPDKWLRWQEALVGGHHRLLIVDQKVMEMLLISSRFDLLGYAGQGAMRDPLVDNSVDNFPGENGCRGDTRMISSSPGGSTENPDS